MVVVAVTFGWCVWQSEAVAWPCRGRPHTHAFLYEIVSNWRSGADVDKFDYFTRDAFYLGLKSSFDARRYIQSLRVLRDKRSACSRGCCLAAVWSGRGTPVGGSLCKRALARGLALGGGA